MPQEYKNVIAAVAALSVLSFVILLILNPPVLIVVAASAGILVIGVFFAIGLVAIYGFLYSMFGGK